MQLSGRLSAAARALISGRLGSCKMRRHPSLSPKPAHQLAVPAECGAQQHGNGFAVLRQAVGARNGGSGAVSHAAAKHATHMLSAGYSSRLKPLHSIGGRLTSTLCVPIGPANKA